MISLFHCIARYVCVATAVSTLVVVNARSARANAIVSPPPLSQLGSTSQCIPDPRSTVTCSVTYSANNDTNPSDEGNFALLVGADQPTPPTGIPEYAVGLSVGSVNDSSPSPPTITFTTGFTITLTDPSGFASAAQGAYLYDLAPGPSTTVKWSGPYLVTVSGSTLSVKVPLTQYVVGHAYYVEIVKAGADVSLDELPSSIVSEQFSLSSYATDFYMDGPEKLQLGATSSANILSRIFAGIRFKFPVTSANNGAWLELGDLNGAFGTTASYQSWTGFYFAAHGSDGSYYAANAQSITPGDNHEFNIASNGAGWQFSIDQQVVGFADFPSNSTLPNRTQAMISNSNVSANTFTPGFRISGLQNYGSDGYTFWTNVTENNISYPTATVSFVDGFSSATFTQIGSVVSSQESVRSTLGVKRLLPTTILLADNAADRATILGRPESPTRRLMCPATTRVGSTSLVRAKDLPSPLFSLMRQVSPNRLVWLVKIQSFSEHQSRTVFRQTDVVDADSGRLLAFSLTPQKPH